MKLYWKDQSWSFWHLMFMMNANVIWDDVKEKKNDLMLQTLNMKDPLVHTIYNVKNRASNQTFLTLY